MTSTNSDAHTSKRWWRGAAAVTTAKAATTATTAATATATTTARLCASVFVEVTFCTLFVFNFLRVHLLDIVFVRLVWGPVVRH